MHICLFVRGKGLNSWLSIVVPNCEFVTFPFVSWVRCGSWVYRFLIFASSLTLCTRQINCHHPFLTLPKHEQCGVKAEREKTKTHSESIRNMVLNCSKSMLNLRLHDFIGWCLILYICLWLGPPWFNLRFSLALTVCESISLFLVSS